MKTGTRTRIRAELPFPWLLFLGAALGSFLAVYWRSLPYPPLFDDFGHVIENRAIRYLLHPRIFLESEATRARPLPYVTFAISYWIAGLSMSWLRSISLALHVANALLLGLFYRRWLAEPRGTYSWGAVATVALFLLHPLATGPVIYLSARGSLLVLFFLLLALLSHAREPQGTFSWLGFLFFGALAFLSRESAAALAPLIVVVHWLSGRRHTELAPYLAPLVAGGAVALSLKASYLDAAWKGFFAISGDVDVHSIGDYLRLSLSLWPRILGLLVSPGRLAIDHQLALPASWLDPAVLGGIALWVFFLGALALFLRGRSRWLFPLCWFFLSLLPTNSIFPLLDPLSERHIYFALPALAWLFGLAVDAAAARLGGVAAGAALLAALVLGDTVTLATVLPWRSGSTAWLEAHELGPTKFRIAFNTAASLISERGDRAGAVRLLGGTLSRLPAGSLRYEEQTDGLNLLVGSVKALAGERGITPRELWSRLGLAENFWAELTILRAEQGSIPLAVWEQHWESARRKVAGLPLSAQSRDPRWIENSFLLLRADALRQAGRSAEALRLYESVILPFPDSHFPYWTAREALGDLYLAAGREEEAVKQYELAAFQYKVFKRFPVDLQNKLYTIFRNRGDFHRASDAIGELVRVRTDDPAVRRLYAELLRQWQNRHAARQGQEADYYSRNSIGPEDEREILRP